MRRFFVVKLALLFISTAHAADEAEQYRLAAFGNSLMGNIKLSALSELAKTRGKTLDFDSTGAAGAPIEWVWKAREKEVGKILSKQWDGIMFQPFLRHVSQDLKSSEVFMELARKESPKIQIWVYAQFTNDLGVDYQDLWEQDIGDWLKTKSGKDLSVPMRTRMYYEALTRELREKYPDLPPALMVPAGHAFALFDEKVKAGLVPGVDDLFQLWADGTHVNNFGSYIVGMTFYATLFRDNPVGLPIGGYQGDPELPYTWVITPEQARVVQETAWEVAATHPLAGVAPVDDPLKVATPAIHPNPVQGEQFRLRMKPAFGLAPYRWKVAAGTLPQGLTLSEDGILAGTPTTTGKAKVTILVTDSREKEARREFGITVEADRAPSITTTETDLGSYSRGEQIRIQLKAEGGNGRLKWDFAGRSGKQRTVHGLQMRGDGIIVGAVGAEGKIKLEAVVSDSDPSKPERDSKTFTMTIGPAKDDVVLVGKVPAKSIKPTWKIRREKAKGEDERAIFVKQYTFTKHPITKLTRGDSFNNKAGFQVVNEGGSRFHALVFVEDDTITENDRDPTKGDSVEIFLDIYNDREKVYNADDRRVIVTPSGKVSGSPGHVTQAGALRVEGGYYVWVNMPTHAMKRKLTPGAVLGFDVSVNDADDSGEVSQVTWRGDERNAEDTSNFGTIIMTDQSAE